MRLLSQDRYSKIKQLQDARIAAKNTASILSTTLTTVKKVYQTASYDEYVERETPTKPTVPSEPAPQFDQVNTVLMNIADWMSSMDRRMEHLEEVHDTKFSFFKGR